MLRFSDGIMPSQIASGMGKSAVVGNPQSETCSRCTPAQLESRVLLGPSASERPTRTGASLAYSTKIIKENLRIYAQALDGDIYHFRDKSDLECDAVLHRRDGSYGLIEIKLSGENAIEYAAENLMKLSERIDTKRMPKPSFLMVVVGAGDFAYRRKDGVLVIPISCLR